ncbi:hypothetical protein DFH09DRAFT_1287715 [Mycena vulgaris]|nr:hypothetical protein DFH09DRAFT_1287715 [Mycena vulgaris]
MGQTSFGCKDSPRFAPSVGAAATPQLSAPTYSHAGFWNLPRHLHKRLTFQLPARPFRITLRHKPHKQARSSHIRATQARRVRRRGGARRDERYGSRLYAKVGTYSVGDVLGKVEIFASRFISTRVSTQYTPVTFNAGGGFVSHLLFSPSYSTPPSKLSALSPPPRLAPRRAVAGVEARPVHPLRFAPFILHRLPAMPAPVQTATLQTATLRTTTAPSAAPSSALGLTTPDEGRQHAAVGAHAAGVRWARCGGDTAAGAYAVRDGGGGVVKEMQRAPRWEEGGHESFPRVDQENDDGAGMWPRGCGQVPGVLGGEGWMPAGGAPVGVPDGARDTVAGGVSLKQLREDRASDIENWRRQRRERKRRSLDFETRRLRSKRRVVGRGRRQMSAGTVADEWPSEKLDLCGEEDGDEVGKDGERKDMIVGIKVDDAEEMDIDRKVGGMRMVRRSLNLAGLTCVTRLENAGIPNPTRGNLTFSDNATGEDATEKGGGEGEGERRGGPVDGMEGGRR